MPDMAGALWRLRHVVLMLQCALGLLLAGDPRCVQAVARIAAAPADNLAWRLRHYGPRLYDDIHAAIEESKAPVFLVYGSLLGLVRDGGPIQGDADADLGIAAKDTWRLVDFADAMRRRGYKLTRDRVVERFEKPGYGYLHVDVYVFHDDGSYVFSQVGDGMGGVIRYGFPRGLVFPVKMLRVGNRAWPVPRNPEEFLARHYGSTWQVPDRDWDYRYDARSRREDIHA